MTTEKYKQIASLMERFFEGLTTNEEERTLYRFFSGEEVPPEWEGYRALFAYFESGLERDVPAKENVFLLRKRWMGWTAVIAASVGLLLVLYSSWLHETPNLYEGSYIIRNGVCITDINLIRPELEATMQQITKEQQALERLLTCADETEREIEAQVMARYEEIESQIADEDFLEEMQMVFELYNKQ